MAGSTARCTLFGLLSLSLVMVSKADMMMGMSMMDEMQGCFSGMQEGTCGWTGACNTTGCENKCVPQLNVAKDIPGILALKTMGAFKCSLLGMMVTSILPAIDANMTAFGRKMLVDGGTSGATKAVEIIQQVFHNLQNMQNTTNMTTTTSPTPMVKRLLLDAAETTHECPTAENITAAAPLLAAGASFMQLMISQIPAEEQQGPEFDVMNTLVMFMTDEQALQSNMTECETGPVDGALAEMYAEMMEDDYESGEMEAPAAMPTSVCRPKSEVDSTMATALKAAETACEDVEEHTELGECMGEDNAGMMNATCFHAYADLLGIPTATSDAVSTSRMEIMTECKAQTDEAACGAVNMTAAISAMEAALADALEVAKSESLGLPVAGSGSMSAHGRWTTVSIIALAFVTAFAI